MLRTRPRSFESCHKAWGSHQVDEDAARQAGGGGAVRGADRGVQRWDVAKIPFFLFPFPRALHFLNGPQQFSC